MVDVSLCCAAVKVQIRNTVWFKWPMLIKYFLFLDNKFQGYYKKCFDNKSSFYY